MKKVLFLYNPLSGENRIINELDNVFAVHQKYGYFVDVIRIDASTDFKEILSKTGGKYEYLLIAGGDGTVDSIINEMLNANVNIPVGILPMGTANDYANYIGMSSDVTQACEQILTLPPQTMDLGMVNDKYFINVLSTGFFTDISQKTDTELKNNFGKIAYYLKSVELLKDFRRSRVKIRSKDFNYDGDMFIMMIFNGITSGGLKMAYKSQGNDGLLDVLLLNGSNKDIVPLIFRILKGEHLDRPVGLEYFQTSELTIECDEEIPTDMDGEKGPSYPLHVRCISDKLRVLGVKNKL